MSVKIDAQAILNALEKAKSDAFIRMTNAEADGNSDRDFHEGVWQGFDYALNLINKITKEGN